MAFCLACSADGDKEPNKTTWQCQETHLHVPPCPVVRGGREVGRAGPREASHTSPHIYNFSLPGGTDGDGRTIAVVAASSNLVGYNSSLVLTAALIF